MITFATGKNLKTATIKEMITQLVVCQTIIISKAIVQ